jgi:hypothetical protein
LGRLRDEPAQEERSRWDSHPPIGVRVATIEKGPQVAGGGDRRPATALVSALGSLLEPVERGAFDFGDRRRVTFEDYTARATQAGHQETADALYRAAARVDGVGRPGLAAVLDLLRAGRQNALVEAFLRPAEAADTDAVRERLSGALWSALATAMVAGRRAFWRHSWSDPVALVTADGAPYDLDPLVADLLSGPDGVARVRTWLHGIGFDETAVVAHQAAATANGADVLAAVADMKVDDVLSDVFILDKGLLVLPSPGKTDDARAKQRLRSLVGQLEPKVLAAQPGARFLAYEDMVAARMVKRLPVGYELTLRDGRAVTIRDSFSTTELGKGLDALERVVDRLGTPAPAGA